MKNKISLSDLFKMMDDKNTEKIKKLIEKAVNDEVKREEIYEKFWTEHREFVRIDYKVYGGMETWRN